MVSVQVWGRSVPGPPAYVTCALHVAAWRWPSHGRAALAPWRVAPRSAFNIKVSNALLAICLERLGAFFRIADEERTRRVDNRYQNGQQCSGSSCCLLVSLNFFDATKLGTARAREPNLKKTGESSSSHSSISYSHTSVVHTSPEVGTRNALLASRLVLRIGCCSCRRGL